MRIRKQLQQPSTTLLEIRNDLDSFRIMSKHLDLKLLRSCGLERVAMKPVRHDDDVSSCVDEC